MIAGAIAAAFLAAGLLWVLAAPLLRRDAADSERRSTALSQARELQSRHDMLVASLRDLEEDRATDKIDQSDYDDLQGRLSAEAVKLMRQLDSMAGERDKAEQLEHAVVSHPSARRRDPAS